MAKTKLLDKILRAVLVGVAGFDLIQGILILFAPRFVAAMLKLPLPSEMFYLWLVGMLQIGLALAYLIGGISPVRHIGNVVLAAVMRLAMAVLLIIIGTTQGLSVFTYMGLAEILVGLSHALYAIRLAPKACQC
jgi:hypothetical protein